MSRLNELTDVVLPLVAFSGRVGENVRFVKCVLDDKASGEAQFASSVSFVTAVFEDAANSQLEIPLVVKYNMDDEAVRNWLKLNHQFQNEVIVYERVLSFLDSIGGHYFKDIFPTFFYGSAQPDQDPNRYMIVLEDLRKSGYQLCSDILDLDFAHCAIAFKKLGAFHALSFKAKKLNPTEFHKVASQLVETRIFEESRDDADYLYACSVGRASDPLLNRGEKVEEINRFRDKLKDSLGYMEKLLIPQEPMAVICHGDFCRNNVLFKYDNRDSKSPVDVKFFDLATSRYASPMIDFSFFFFLNNSEDSRQRHREEYLKIYHDSLTSHCVGVEVPSLEDFQEEFRQKAVYGFLLCSFFKPAMMDTVPFDPSVEVKKSIRERAATVLAKGGDKGTELTSNMLRELIELNCVL